MPIPVVYRTPITEKDAGRILAGHCRIYATVRRGRPPAANSPGRPPELNFVLVGAGHQFWPTGWSTHTLPLYLEPPPP